MEGDHKGIDELPSQDELVIGLVAPLGIDLDEVGRRIARVFGGFAYQCHHVRLTDQLREFNWNRPLAEEPIDERISSYMSAGNHLRKVWSRDDAFAFLAVVAINLIREENQGKPLGRHAFIVRSLKRKEEAEFLRKVYRDRFVLLSLYSPKDSRIGSLKRMIEEPKPVHSAETLVARDDEEMDDHGQNVRGIFHEGDFFIDLQKDIDKEASRRLQGDRLPRHSGSRIMQSTSRDAWFAWFWSPSGPPRDRDSADLIQLACSPATLGE